MRIVYFIDTDEIKQVGLTNTNVEDSVIASTLRIVQDTVLKPILGGNFFRHLQSSIADSVLSASEEVLIDSVIKPFLIACVDHRIPLHLHTEIRAKTVGSANDQYYKTSEMAMLNRLQDQLQRDLDSYRHALTCYLRENRDLFPEYNKFLCSCEKPSDGESGYNNIISFI